MTDLRITTTGGIDKILEAATVQNFADSLRGRLVGPGNDSYDEARKVGNGMIDRHPALIVRCAEAADARFEGNVRRVYGRLSRMIEKQFAR